MARFILLPYQRHGSRQIRREVSGSGASVGDLKAYAAFANEDYRELQTCGQLIAAPFFSCR